VKKIIIVAGGCCVGGWMEVVVKKLCGKWVTGGVDGSTML
jgi:hypothetical protein